MYEEACFQETPCYFDGITGRFIYGRPVAMNTRFPRKSEGWRRVAWTGLPQEKTGWPVWAHGLGNGLLFEPVFLDGEPAVNLTGSPVRVPRVRCGL